MHGNPTGPVRWLWLAVAYIALALGAAGVLLPGLPTTPFVLLAGYAAARGSRSLHQWLHRHHVFGPVLADWERHGAVSLRARRVAWASMAVCAVVIVLTAPRLWMAAIAIVIMAVVAVWLWRRPLPPA